VARAKTLRVSEAAWTAQLLALAALLGWRSLHVRPARVKSRDGGDDEWRTPVAGDGAGWPDLFLVRGTRAVAAELKTNTAPGPRPEQTAWLEALAATGVETYVWRPRDLKTAAWTLSRARG
jgi:hypothetical protein